MSYGSLIFVPNYRMKFQSFLILLLVFISANSFQKQNPIQDKEATDLLQKVSEKYKGYKTISANFQLLTQRPKLKPEDDDKKYIDTLSGQVVLQGAKFKIHTRQQQVICDGKNIWTYAPEDKEVQVNLFQESDDVFSPSKIFSLYKEGYLYQVKEKKTAGAKKLVVIETAPNNKKSTYFKIDITIDETNLQITESKVYEKNGVRYIYKLTKQTFNAPATDDEFTFNTKKFPGVKVVDLR